MKTMAFDENAFEKVLTITGAEHIYIIWRFRQSYFIARRAKGGNFDYHLRSMYNGRASWCIPFVSARFYKTVKKAQAIVEQIEKNREA